MAYNPNDAATKIQIGNLRREVDTLKSVLSDILSILQKSNPEIAIKYSNLMELK